MSFNHPAIAVRGLSKSYTIRRNAAKHTTLADIVVDRIKHPFRRAEKEVFWALRDLNFEVAPGEIVGIIGRNGAGKSTLLKILSRITRPTSGEIELRGRVGSLLEVGTGFHQELTGRENIYLSGTILGMKHREIKEQFDAIIDFAGIEQFLDTPVKRYSSGMYVRLAFAVAAHLETQILIVDEVLAVGDIEFQKKCLGKMQNLSRNERRTVIFVSHQMTMLQSLCTRCVLLEKGEFRASGKPSSIIGDYLRKSAPSSEWINAGDEYTNPYFKPNRFTLVQKDLQPVRRDVEANEEIGILIEGEVTELNSTLCVGFAVYTVDGILLYWSYQIDTQPKHWPEIRLGKNRLLCWLPRHAFNEGDYRFELLVSLHFRAWLCEPLNDAPSIQLRIRGGLSLSPLWVAARPGLLAPILPFVPAPCYGDL